MDRALFEVPQTGPGDRAEPGPAEPPPPLGAGHAAAFGLTKRALVVDPTADRPGGGAGPDGAGGWAIRQTGGAVVGGPVPLGLSAAHRTVTGVAEPTEAAIETFLVDDGASCTPLGGHRELAEAWAPSVTPVVEAVLAGLAGIGVVPAGPIYATASLTPAGEPSGRAHFDDDRYEPDAGVGLVAIVGDREGPRVACRPVPCRPVRAGLPIEVEPPVLDRFGHDPASYRQVGPERIVVLPQFGQLHAGPRFDPPDTSGVRSLIVLRAPTGPAGSGHS